MIFADEDDLRREQEAAKYGPKAPTEQEAFAKKAADAILKGRGTPITQEEMASVLARKFPEISSREIGDLYAMATVKQKDEAADSVHEEILKELAELKRVDPARHAELVAKWKVDAVDAEKRLRKTLDRMDRAVETFPHLKNDPSAALELYDKLGEKLKANADAARLRIKARLTLRKELDALLGKTVIVEKKGIASTCCGLLLKGTLKPHEDGLGQSSQQSKQHVQASACSVLQG